MWAIIVGLIIRRLIYAVSIPNGFGNVNWETIIIIIPNRCIIIMDN